MSDFEQGVLLFFMCLGISIALDISSFFVAEALYRRRMRKLRRRHHIEQRLKEITKRKLDYLAEKLPKGSPEERFAKALREVDERIAENLKADPTRKR